MKAILISIFAILFATGFNEKSQPITLDMTLSFDGVEIGKPKVVTVSGQEASITSELVSKDRYSIKVVPVLNKDNTVHMKFEVAIKRGDYMFKSHPEILTSIGSEAEITHEPSSVDQVVGTPDISKEEPKRISLKVTPSI